MNGITTAPWRESFGFVHNDVRYLKVKDSAHNFAVVQFGVCPFHWDPVSMSFVSNPHNFYIFPRQELPADGPTYEFLCQTSSITFLAKYQFDFNACIREEEVKIGLHQQAKKVKEAVGFRHVIDLLSDEKKVIVSHNCFLDLAHVYHKFFGPLPSNVLEFVSNIHNTFPCIIDTKILLNSNKDLQKLMKKASTSLASAFSLLCLEISSRRSSGSGLEQCVKVEVHVDDMRFILN